MSLTRLDEGSIWNIMPVHTHEQCMEVYTYFDFTGENVVYFIGQPQQTRHIVMKNEEAVISPSYSIHAGCSMSNYVYLGYGRQKYRV